MKYRLILTMLLGINSFCFAQTIPGYNFHINLAELHIADARYDSALLNYEKAFNERQNAFAKDYYNASLCAVKRNNFSIAGGFLYKLAGQGYTIDSLRSKKGFEKYLGSPAFKELENKINSSALQPVKDPALKQAVDLMLQDDQYFRIRNRGDYMKHEYAAVIRQLDSINAFKLVRLVRDKGFPNESVIGVYNNWLSSYIVDPVILHQQYGSPTRVVDLAPLLLESIRKGEVSINHGIALYSRMAGRDSLFGTNSFFNVQQSDGTYKFAYYPILTDGYEEKCNVNRAAYGMESLAEYRKKMLFFLKQGEFVYDIMLGISVENIEKILVPYYKGIKYFD